MVGQRLACIDSHVSFCAVRYTNNITIPPVKAQKKKVRNSFGDVVSLCVWYVIQQQEKVHRNTPPPLTLMHLSTFPGNEGELLCAAGLLINRQPENVKDSVCWSKNWLQPDTNLSREKKKPRGRPVGWGRPVNVDLTSVMIRRRHKLLTNGRLVLLHFMTVSFPD